MSNQYVFIEKTTSETLSCPNYLIHKIGDLSVLTPYAVHVAKTMLRFDPSAEFLLINIEHLADSADTLVNLSPKALSDQIDATNFKNRVRRYSPEDGFQYVISSQPNLAN